MVWEVSIKGEDHSSRSASSTGDRSIALYFSLPAGSYATTVLRELQKDEGDAP